MHRKLLEMDDDNDEADRKKDEGAREEKEKDYMQENDTQSSDKVGAKPDLSTKSNGQPAGYKSKNIMHCIPAHLNMMEDDMIQWEHTEDMEDVDDMEEMENVEEIYNEMNSPGVEASGSEPAMPRTEAQRDLAALPEVETPSRRSRRRADTADEPSLEHGERIKATSNLDSIPKRGKKITSHASSLQFSNEHVVYNLSAVGISLGNCVDSIINSAACVKDAELKRLDTILSEDKISSVFDKEEMEIEEVDKLILNSLSRERS
jgi:hypothetical protein